MLSILKVAEASLIIVTPSIPAPCCIVRGWSLQAAIALLFFKCLEEHPSTSSSRKTLSTGFDVVAVRVPLHAANNSNAVHPLDVLWHRRGANVPLYVGYEKRRNVFILAGGSPYRPIEHPTTSRTLPSPDELAPIRRWTTTITCQHPPPPRPLNHHHPTRGRKTRKR